jgi:hypothetical protein
MSETKTCAEHRTVEFFKNHPRMMGVLFTLCVLLTQAGNVAAANGGGIY